MLSNDDASELSSYASPSHIFPHAVPSNNYQSAPPKKQNKIPMHPMARARSEHNVFAQSSLHTFSSRDVLQEYNSHGGVELKLDQQCQNDHIDYHRHESKRKTSQKSNTEGVASSQRTKALQQIMAEMEELYELRARAVQEKQSTVFWEKQIRELQQSIFSICEETAYAAACSPAAMVIDPQDENCIENTINSQEIAAVATAIRANRENSCNNMGLATVSKSSSKSFDSYEQRREERSVQSEDERIHAHDQRNDSYEILHAMTDNSFNTLTTKNKDRQSVKVRAPADLPGGHTFVAKTKGRSIIAVVPEGGVRKGEIFRTAVQQEEQKQIPIAIAKSQMPSMSYNGGGYNNHGAQMNVKNNVKDISFKKRNTVKVRAPADLEEGFTFRASFGNRTVVATVPKGGVRKGDLFSVPFNSR
eukprot:CAMPEP_0178941278 /NCGR_PEP_ID=MMETSP0789-20121207/1312_1 /TAXON_ID=3005 /ORGANISM="Rhizosolenia setigera, Strain CCMP 1694" /LENGTH=417 /DNA_ID=CAMNT_0020620483 /DNA_START=186 /DNA_END=1439 /DNA_ORIENTATION=-